MSETYVTSLIFHFSEIFSKRNKTPLFILLFHQSGHQYINLSTSSICIFIYMIWTWSSLCLQISQHLTLSGHQQHSVDYKDRQSSINVLRFQVDLHFCWWDDIIQDGQWKIIMKISVPHGLIYQKNLLAWLKAFNINIIKTDYIETTRKFCWNLHVQLRVSLALGHQATVWLALYLERWSLYCNMVHHWSAARLPSIL